MVLKAVLFDFNGVIINDEPLHEKLLAQILIEENMRANPDEFREVCLGRSDRACLHDLLERRGRVASDDYLSRLITRKALLYRQQIESLESVPTYSGITDLVFKIRVANLAMAVVSGAVRSEIEWVLNKLDLAQYFSVIVAGDDITTSKPDPTGYLLAVDRLNEQNPALDLKPEECLVIEDTFSGIEAGKQAGMKVVGVANSYPYHMMQRQSNWAVDYLSELELDRVIQVFAGGEKPVAKD
jgi:beta-phosphoglucomutase